MYRDTNKQILEEIVKLNFLKKGDVVGRNKPGTTTVTSLGKFYSNVMNQELYIGLKEYARVTGSTLDMQVATELGLIDLVEKNIPNFDINEFPLFHGILLNSKQKCIGVITEDFSKNGTIPVESIADEEFLPYEIQNLIGRPEYPKDLATTCFLVDGKRRIGDFGEFIPMLPHEKLELAKDYLYNMTIYSVKNKLIRD
jgi:hypothetical protein